LLAARNVHSYAVGANQAPEVKQALEPKQVLKLTHGIFNERQFYYKTEGLLPVLTGSASKWPKRLPSVWKNFGMLMKDESRVSLNHPVVLTFNIGVQGYYAGPATHIVDVLALTDPFLARLPAVSNPLPRVGHYARLVPLGYCETVLKNTPTTDIESLRPLLNDVTLAARAPLFLPERWSAIQRLMFEQKNYSLGNFRNGAIENGAYEHYDYGKAMPKLIQTR
jgi:arabinofuranosyltransferase